MASYEFETHASGHRVPKCKPNLMPFNVSYTGTAPISTYFRVRETKSRVGCPETTDSPSDPPTASGSSNSRPDGEDISMSDPPESEKPQDSPFSLTKSKLSQWLSHLSHTAKRYVSSFRGRVVHGFEMPFPEGYTGVVFRVDTSAKRGLNTMAEDFSSELGTKSLTLASTFPQFVIWSPDIPVNETRDEYIRGITEWTFLADQIHRSEDV